MDAQQAYDTVKAHLLAQNARSSDAFGCRYRDDAGLKCAIGCLIPDELYRPGIEGRTASLLPSDILRHIGVDGPLLDVLQGVHDTWEPEAWPTRLPLVAARFGLEP